MSSVQANSTGGDNNSVVCSASNEPVPVLRLVDGVLLFNIPSLGSVLTLGISFPSSVVAAVISLTLSRHSISISSSIKDIRLAESLGLTRRVTFAFSSLLGDWASCRGGGKATFPAELAKLFGPFSPPRNSVCV